MPLGPFLGKSFATSIVAVGHAAAPRSSRAASPRPAAGARAARRTCARRAGWALDIALEVELSGDGRHRRTSARRLYWSVAQQLAHLTVNGAPACGSGDL